MNSLVCAIDVGTANLAYCVMDQEFKIVKWDVINCVVSNRRSAGGEGGALFFADVAHTCKHFIPKDCSSYVVELQIPQSVPNIQFCYCAIMTALEMLYPGRVFKKVETVFWNWAWKLA